ncbi:MAG: hypothetical protein Q9184_005007 [Pyrenodesmia sp. 2 TL-2023]
MATVVNENWHSDGAWARAIPPWPGHTGNQSNNGGNPQIPARRTTHVHRNNSGQPGRRNLEPSPTSNRGSLFSAPFGQREVPVRKTGVLWTIKFFSLCLVVVLASLYVGLFFSPPFPDFYIDETHCLWILSSTKALKYFPLPHPIDREVHGGILTKLDRLHMLRHLEDARSDARRTVATAVEEMIGFLAKGAQTYSRFPSEDTFIAIHRHIDILHERFNLTQSHLGALTNIYELLGDDYRTLNATASEDFEKGQLSVDEDFWVRVQPVLNVWLGSFNATKEYLDPLKEKLKRSEEARLGLLLWERDTRTIQQVARVVQEMRCGLWRLTASLPPPDTATSDHDRALKIERWKKGWPSLLQSLPGSKILKPPESRQRWLGAWFRQHMTEDSPLKELWMGAVSSVDDDEQKLPIEIKSQWCERVEI